jgi:pyridoxamine 5'-phosphate oxidase
MKNVLREPQDIRQQIWKELGRASVDRHHEWRTPVLATVGCDGSPNARTVVLRKVDARLLTFCFYTDARSAKVSEITKEPKAVLAFWSGRLNWQLRVKVEISVATDGPEIQALWQRIQQSASATDYMASASPGTERTTGFRTAQNLSGDHHFALLNAQVLQMDWLELGRGGHRRASMSADTWQWLVP